MNCDVLDGTSVVVELHGGSDCCGIFVVLVDANNPIEPAGNEPHVRQEFCSL